MVVESCLGVTQRLSLTRVWRAYLLLMPEGGAGVLEMLTWMSSQLRSAVDTGKLQLTIYPPQVSVVIEVLTGCLLDHHQHAVAVFVETVRLLLRIIQGKSEVNNLNLFLYSLRSVSLGKD